MKKNFLFDIGITNATKEEILEYILTSLQKGGEHYYIVTPNPEFLVYACKHPQFKSILNNARLALPDGLGVILAGKIMGQPFVERIAGADFMELLCKHVAEKPITVGFLGGRGDVAERAAECLQVKYPGLKVGFVGEEWGKEGFVRASRLELRIMNQELRKKTKNKNHNSLFMLHNSIDILFVAFGFPKQEEFMASHVGKIPVKVMMGVGGSFDYISGRVPRAPLFIRSIGFEWLFRLLIQPWRIKRQLALIEFAWLVLKQKMV